MRLPDTTPIIATAAPPWRRIRRWLSTALRHLALPWGRNDLDQLDNQLRRDIGLSRSDVRPDAAALLDMSRPGGRRR